MLGSARNAYNIFFNTLSIGLNLKLPIYKLAGETDNLKYHKLN